YSAANATYRTSMLVGALDGLLTRDVMRADPPTVEATIPLASLAEQLLADPARDPSIVLRGGEPVGIVGHSALRRVRPARLSQVPVGQVMRPFEPNLILAEELPAGQALQTLLESGHACLPVVAEGQLRGLIRREDLFRLIEIRRRLQR